MDNTQKTQRIQNLGQDALRDEIKKYLRGTLRLTGRSMDASNRQQITTTIEGCIVTISFEVAGSAAEVDYKDIRIEAVEC